MIVTIKGGLASRCARTVAVIVFLITVSISGALHADQSNTDCASVSDTDWGGVNRDTLCIGIDRDGACERTNSEIRGTIRKLHNQNLDDLDKRKEFFDEWIDETIKERENLQKEAAECSINMLPSIESVNDSVCSLLGITVPWPLSQLCSCLLANDRMNGIDEKLESRKQARDQIQSEIRDVEDCLADSNLCYSADLFLDCDE